MTFPLASAVLEWREEWNRDLGFMDEDHRRLVALVNRLARDFCIRPVPSQPSQVHAPLSEALEELAHEARLHFQREEQVMRSDGYPELEDHKADHDLLLAELSVLTRELHDAEAESLDEPVIGALKDWLLGHALDFDRQLAEFVKNPRQTEPSPVSSD